MSWSKMFICFGNKEAKQEHKPKEALIKTLQCKKYTVKSVKPDTPDIEYNPSVNTFGFK